MVELVFSQNNAANNFGRFFIEAVGQIMGWFVVRLVVIAREGAYVVNRPKRSSPSDDDDDFDQFEARLEADHARIVRYLEDKGEGEATVAA